MFGKSLFACHPDLKTRRPRCVGRRLSRTDVQSILRFEMKIHPTAVVHPNSNVNPTVVVGPYCVIDEAVEIGADCVIAAYVHLTGHTVIGMRNRFHSGSVIGDAPQDLKYGGEKTRLVIGDDNVFREHVTVHRSNNQEEETHIGSRNYLMAHSHVGHNCRIGDNVIIANGALLGGHVIVGDRAFISGNCLIHQFVRIGTLALMQGGSAVSKDVPPYTIACGVNEICGLNGVGMRRAGITVAERLELKRLYRRLFLSGKGLHQALKGINSEEPLSAAAQTLTDFISSSARGVCQHGRQVFNEQEGARDQQRDHDADSP